MAGPEPVVRWQPGHGWLAALLGAHVRSFRSADPELGATLAASGATQAAERPDVELAERAADLRGDAAAAILRGRRPPREGAGRAARVLGRAGGWAALGAEAARARRRLRALGYGDVVTIPWDQLRQPEIAGGRRAHARLPLEVLLAGARGERGPTVVEEAVAAAGSGLAGLRGATPRVGLSGVVLVLGDTHVVRAVLAAGAGQIESGTAFLAALRAADPPAAVADRIAWPLATGSLPLARWVAEPRLPGSPSRPPLAPDLLEDVVDFLAALFATGQAPGEDAIPLAAAGRVVARVCPPELGREVEALAARLDAALGDVPRGPGHGDFWTENLLVADGRLRGVVDWGGAAPRRLPLLDLLHLHAAAEQARSGRHLGEVVTGWLVPAAPGSRDGVGAYCRRMGLEPDDALLRRLAVAYWLEHVAAHLTGFADRAARPGWLAANVVQPAQTLIRAV